MDGTRSLRTACCWLAASFAAWLGGCGGQEAEGRGGEDGDGASSTSGTTGGTPNVDGDCLSDEEEAELGTDPSLADTDADGIGDCDEVDCVSDPLDPGEKCYACGWEHGDPGSLVSTGNEEGDVIANLEFVDQCSEQVRLWDFAGGYHILFMTAAW